MPDKADPGNGIRIGLSEQVITPPPGVKMAGFSARKGVSQGVHDDLHVRSLVIEGPDTAVAVLTTFPGEVFVEIGLEVKRRSSFPKTLVVGVANAGRTGGYLPTVETFDEGDYEILASKYSEGAAEVLIEATLEQIGQLVEDEE